MRDIYESQTRLDRIEKALAEMWCIHDVQLLSDEALIVRIVEMRAEALQQCVTELLAAHERLVAASFAHQSKTILPRGE